MNTKIERFFSFIMKEKTRSFFAFVFYVSFIVMFMGIDLPIVLEIICFIVQIFIILFGYPVYMFEWMDKMYEKNIIIIAPIIEEFIFRFLPYRFIKNKTLYIIVSTVVFAAMHVLNDPNPFYYIWCYMMGPLYYGYRYHKTKDIWVTISIHSFNNLIAMLLLILS